MIDLLDIAATRQKYSRIHDTPGITLTLTSPTLLVFTGDWHLGAPGTDYELFKADLERLHSAKLALKEKLLIVGMGDYVDGYLSRGTPKAEHDQVLSPVEQRIAAKRALELLRPSLVLIGDHDLWLSGGELGYNWLHDWAAESGVPYAEWGGEIELWTGARVWRLLVRHRYKGSVTGQDHLKPHKNLFQEYGPADAVVLAHSHARTGVYKVSPVRSKESRYWAVQTGTYKLKDTYGKKVSANPAEYCVPAILVSDSGIEAFDRYQDGLRALYGQMDSKGG